MNRTDIIPWTAKVIDCVDEEAWRIERKKSIGASDSAPIFGVGYENQSAVTVWQSKVLDELEPISDATRRLLDRGKRMESIIAAEFVAETELSIIDPGDFTIFKHPEMEWLSATIDRCALHDEWGPVPVEMKNIHGRFWREWDADYQTPLKHVVQCQHQMVVTDTKRCFLVGLIGGHDLKIRVIDRDDRFIEVMLKRLESFWGLVKRRQVPPVDDRSATSRALALIYSRDDGESIPLPLGAEDWDAKLSETKKQIDQLVKTKTELENKIKAAIGSATYGEIPGGGRFSWKLQRKKSYTVKASETRVLRRVK